MLKGWATGWAMHAWTANRGRQPAASWPARWLGQAHHSRERVVWTPVIFDVASEHAKQRNELSKTTFV